MTKAERHEAIRERGREALRDLYHNATPSYPSLDEPEAARFQAWFDDAAQFEIEYLNDGGAYGSNYQPTLACAANAGKLKSPAARAYYIRKGMRDMRVERARCNSLGAEFGKIYTWGRGGRTLAPAQLIKTRAGIAFVTREDAFDEMSIARCVECLRIVESFNAYVAAWCKAVPDMWREYQTESLEENAERAYN
jgi:hypothetical protein